MNFVTLEELVEADTTLVSAPKNNGQPSDSSRNVPDKSRPPA
jgi:hypothetical protein